MDVPTKYHIRCHTCAGELEILSIQSVEPLRKNEVRICIDTKPCKVCINELQEQLNEENVMDNFEEWHQ